MNKTNTTTTTEKKNHAEQNAEGHAETILELYRAHKALTEDGAEAVEFEGYEYADADLIRERAQETALSVEVRGGWRTPGADADNSAEEFRILLTTGGPALQITGDVDEHGQPDNPRLMVQDWGTPWTEYRPDCYAADDYDDAMAWYLSCFYFGE